MFLSLLRFDSELDKNGDASLDTEEILTWIIPTNEEIATDEVDWIIIIIEANNSQDFDLFWCHYSVSNFEKVAQLFSGADKDGDELLTFEEVSTYNNSMNEFSTRFK